MSVNAIVHKVLVAEKLVVEDVEQLASALRYFGVDLPLERTLAVELLQETLSDGSDISTIRIRVADDVR